MTNKELAQIALEMTKQSYSPYSKFRVGVALETTSGIFKGTNVENRSYGLTICAERNAIFSAIAEGQKVFSRIAIASCQVNFITPCGACLQVISEFCDDLEIILVNEKAEIKLTCLKELYPLPFKL